MLLPVLAIAQQKGEIHNPNYDNQRILTYGFSIGFLIIIYLIQIPNCSKINIKINIYHIYYFQHQKHFHFLKNLKKNL